MNKLIEVVGFFAEFGDKALSGGKKTFLNQFFG